MYKKKKYYIIVLSTIICGLLVIPNVISIGNMDFSKNGDTINQLLGKAVEYLGDSDGNGYVEIVFLDDIGGAYIYEYNSSLGIWEEKIHTGQIYGFTNTSDCWDLACGDFNGDDFNDLVISIYSTGAGKFHLFLGSSTGLTYDADVNGATTGDDFGYSIDSGDFDGDGYDDLLVGAPNVNNNNGSCYIYFGLDNSSLAGGDWPDVSNINNEKIITINGSSTLTEFGVCVRNLGDVNNNTGDDFSITAESKTANPERPEYHIVCVFYGDATYTSISSSPDVTLTGHGRFGADVDGGDIDNDGYNDLVTAQYIPVRGERVAGGFFVYIYYGSEDGINTNNISYKQLATNIDPGPDSYDICVMGDDNGDGFDDIVISEPTYNTNTGRVHGIWCNQSRMNITSPVPCSNWTKVGSANGDKYGYYRILGGKCLCGIPDMDSSDPPKDELLIGIPYYDLGVVDRGRVELYKGS